MRRALLIVGIACILSGVFLLCLWEVSWRILSAVADSSAPIADTPTLLPLPQIRQGPLVPSAPAGSGKASGLVSKPTGTPPPAVGPARPAPGGTVIYRVRPGDTLFRIALDFGVTVETLIRFNNLANADKVWAGQELVIPGDGVATPTRSAVTHATGAATRLPTTPIPPAPGKVNGVPTEQLVIISPGAKQNIRKIYAQGQARGNNPRAFSKIGDSNMENPYFLAPFDDEAYELGDYAYLQPVVDYFSGSFGRQSMAVRQGFHSWSVLDASLADETACLPDETPVGCELRLHNPSIVLIRLGTNDAGYPQRLREKLQAIVGLCVQRGAIPILGTKADRAEGPDNINNTIIRQVAADNNLPLWDLDRVTQTLPDSGLGQDHVHLTSFEPLDYTLPEAFQHGHSVDNLTALIALDQVWRAITQVK